MGKLVNTQSLMGFLALALSTCAYASDFTLPPIPPLNQPTVVESGTVQGTKAETPKVETSQLETLQSETSLGTTTQFPVLPVAPPASTQAVAGPAPAPAPAPQVEKSDAGDTEDIGDDAPQFPISPEHLQPLTEESVMVPIDQVINNKKFNGAVLVAQGTKVLFKQAYGYIEGNTQTPYEKDTKFLLASATKEFTAALVLKETEKLNPKINLDDPISKFFDKIPKSWKDITISKLLSHTSGLGDYNYPKAETRPCYTKTNTGFFIDDDEVSIKKVARMKTCPEYEGKYAYSNTNYFLLAKILERVTHKTFAALFKEEITEPLGMKDTAMIDPNKQGSAKLYDSDGTPLLPYQGIHLFGVGNAYSSLEDLLKWVTGLFDEDLVISRRLVKMMETPQSSSHGYKTLEPIDPSKPLIWKSKIKGRIAVNRNFRTVVVPVDYGFGVRLLTLSNGEKIVYHTGHIKRTTTLVAHYLKSDKDPNSNDNITIIILTNTEKAEVLGLEGEIAQAVFKVPGFKPRGQDQLFALNKGKDASSLLTSAKAQTKHGKKHKHRRTRGTLASNTH